MFNQMPQWFFYVLTGVFGAIMGSFANVCIVRVPKHMSVVMPPSHCPKCGRQLAWWENIPVVSYVILLGRCATCKEKISLLYPIVEILCVMLSLLAWFVFAHPLPYLLYFCLLIIPLVIVSFIDADHRIIPDSISLVGIPVGIAVRVVLAPQNERLAYGIDSVIGAFVGGAILFLVAIAYEKIKKQEGLGGGDIKLIAMLGAFFGWKAAILILFISSVLGSIVGLIAIALLRRDMKYAIPFGPFLSAAGLLQLFVGKGLIHWYLGLFL